MVRVLLGIRGAFGLVSSRWTVFSRGYESHAIFVGVRGHGAPGSGHRGEVQEEIRRGFRVRRGGEYLYICIYSELQV